MRILVTGGAGFIGSHLVEALLGQGDEVIVLDDLSTGLLSNLARFEQDPRFEFVQGDVTDARLVHHLVGQCEMVYHLAAAVGVKYVLEYPLRSLLVNIRGVEVVLEACHMHQRKPILFSSSEVYGKGVTVPFSEDDDRVMGPSHKLRWSYALGKAVDECLAQAYWQQHRLPVVTVRCFNTCGPRQTGAYGMVIPSLITRALLGRPMLVYGDGQQTRCFSHVSDVVRGVLMLAAEPAAEGEVFNIGTQEEVSILDLAKRIKGMTGSDSPIQFVSYEQVYGHLFEDMRRRVPDLRKVERMVGYRPRATLDELLADTIEHIRGELKAAQPVAARA